MSTSLDPDRSKIKVKIFTTHHSDFFTIDNPIIENIRASNQYCPEGTTMRGNDEGDNIADRSKSFCELTTQYWVWKNIPDLDYYGFSHYRRFISFNDDCTPDVYGNVFREHYTDSLKSEMGYDCKDLEEEISKYDIILTDGWDVTGCGVKNIYEQYANATELNIKDLDCAISILKEKYPQYSKAADEYLNGPVLYPCNIFIMKKSIFQEYNEWLFDILFELEKRSDVSQYSDVQYRMIGHVAERLLGIFVQYQKELNNYNVGIKKRFVIQNMNKFVLPKPAFEENNVPVVFAANSNFAPYTASALWSMAKHCSTEMNYDVFVLYTEMSDFGKDLIKRVVSAYSNINVRFLNVTYYVEKYNLKPNFHISVETFYRLLAPELFFYYSKILYLDGDLIVLEDVSKLYSIDMGTNLVAGVIDSDFISQYNGGNKPIKKYADEELKLIDPMHYLQAGVLVFNLDAMRAKFQNYELLKLGNNRQYIYGDQDIINIACQGAITYVDMSWNTMHYCNGARKNMLTMCCPRELFSKYLESRKHPKIIHYAGYSKPWNNPEDDMADIYWREVRDSCVYEILLSRMMDRKCSSTNSPTNTNNTQMGPVKTWLWKIKIVRKVYFKLHPNQ